MTFEVAKDGGVHIYLKTQFWNVPGWTVGDRCYLLKSSFYSEFSFIIEMKCTCKVRSPRAVMTNVLELLTLFVLCILVANAKQQAVLQLMLPKN